MKAIGWARSESIDLISIDQSFYRSIGIVIIRSLSWSALSSRVFLILRRSKKPMTMRARYVPFWLDCPIHRYETFSICWIDVVSWKWFARIWDKSRSLTSQYASWFERVNNIEPFTHRFIFDSMHLSSQTAVLYPKLCDLISACVPLLNVRQKRQLRIFHHTHHDIQKMFVPFAWLLASFDFLENVESQTAELSSELSRRPCFEFRSLYVVLAANQSGMIGRQNFLSNVKCSFEEWNCCAVVAHCRMQRGSQINLDCK